MSLDVSRRMSSVQFFVQFQGLSEILRNSFGVELVAIVAYSSDRVAKLGHIFLPTATAIREKRPFGGIPPELW